MIFCFYCQLGWSTYCFIIFAWEFYNKLSVRRVNVLFFENSSARFPSRISYVTVYIAARKVLQSTGRAHCVFATRYEMQTLSQAGFLIELLHNLLHVLRSRSVKSGSSDFLFLDSDTSCARGWFRGRASILLSIGDETFANSLEIPCERTMISKFVLSNGRQCCATRKTTSELNVVSSCCHIALLVGKKVTALKGYFS